MSQLDSVALMAATLYVGLSSKPQPDKQPKLYEDIARQAWALYFAVEDEEKAATERHHRAATR